MTIERADRRPGAGPQLSPLDGSTSLRERVSGALRAALVAGELLPGIVYSAPALAQQLGVSATPVREAMIDLVQQGLVEPVRNKGFRVTELSDTELDDITEVRALLEVPTIGGLATTATTEQLASMRPVAEEIVEAWRERDLIRYVDVDLRFHLTILGWAGNRRLVELVRDLRFRSRLHGLHALAEEERAMEVAREHHLILDALEQRDRSAAEAVMRRHLAHVRGIWAATRSDADDGEALGTCHAV